MYFLSGQKLDSGKEVEIAGEEAAHILLSHRIKKGEMVKLQDMDGKRYQAEVGDVGKKTLTVIVGQSLPVPREPVVNITLFQSVVALNTLDIILQKSVELGAARVVLFNSNHTATKLSPEKFQDKYPRWQKVLWEAAKQCERGQVPQLDFVDDLEGVVEYVKKLDLVLVLDITGTKLANKDPKIKSIGLVVGPEGGLSRDELSPLLHLSTAKAVTLGPLMLRADTAAISALAVVQNLLN